MSGVGCSGRFLFSIISSLLTSATIFAASVEEVPVSELGQKSDWVGRATVVHTETVELSNFVYTRVTFEVSESIKGSDVDQKVVYVPGGRLSNGKVMKVAGVRQVEKDKEYLIFVKRDYELNVNVMTAWTSYLVMKDVRTGARFVRTGEHTLIGKRGGSRAFTAASSQILAYEDVVTDIVSGLD